MSPGREFSHVLQSVGSAVSLQEKVRLKDQVVKNVSLQNIAAKDLGA